MRWWKLAAARALWVTINVLNRLKVALYPYLPFSSQKLHGLLGFEGPVAADGWAAREIPAGQRLPAPQALFVKLDEEQVIEEETRRLESGRHG